MSERSNPASPKPPSVDRLSLLWHRINDHKMVQWSVAYIALAYGVQHGVELTSDAFEWPHAVVRISMLLLVLGLPLVMTLAWYHGQRASRRISGPELTIISLLLVGISFLFYVFARPAEEVAAGPKPAVQQTSVATSPVSSAQAGAISLAVLPFVNLSGDVGQEFFSDGMTEEITSALAKVQNLRVVARTSAFQFKGENRDIQAIAQALHATHLIEGSVRKDGNQLRITAQLIKADDGTHLWTESYDRELKGVFAVQEEIAQAIAGALRVPLGLQQGANLVSSRTGDLDSYQQFLRARSFFHARQIPETIAILEPLVERDGKFAPAWGLLSLCYEYMAAFDPRLRGGPIEDARRMVQSAHARAEKAAREAIRLDPNSALGYMALAVVESVSGNRAAGEDLYLKALTLDPNDPDTLDLYSQSLGFTGRFKEALRVRQQLIALEPLVQAYRSFAAEITRMSGRNADAITMFEAIQGEGALRYIRDVYLAQAYAAAGRYNDAADAVLTIPQERVPVSRKSVEEAARLLRTAPQNARASAALPALEGELGFVYTHVGASERILEFPERLAQVGAAALGSILFWPPESAAIRKTQRFKTLIRNAGLLDYWRAKGWPDLCHPVGTDDFVCD